MCHIAVVSDVPPMSGCGYKRTPRPCWRYVCSAVPPIYLIRATNEFFAAGGDALFTAKDARCFSETAVGFFCLLSATLLARQEVPASP